MNRSASDFAALRRSKFGLRTLAFPWWLRLYRAGVIVALAILVSAQARWFDAQRPSPLSIRVAQKFFPEANRIQLRDLERGLHFVTDIRGETIGCLLTTSPQTDDIIGHSGPNTMGTTWSVRTFDEVANPAAVQKTISNELEWVESMISHWRPRTDLAQFNQARETNALPVAWPVVTLSRWAAEVSRETGGALDVTAGGLVNRWGFGPPPRPAVPPTDAEIAALLPSVGWQKLAAQFVIEQPGGRLEVRETSGWRSRP